MMITQNGYAIKFNEQSVRPMGRSASGVKAITLKDDDVAVCMDIAVEGEEVLVISENGFGKRTPVEEYKRQQRGGIGLITYKITEKTGKVVGATICKHDDELMLINSSGVAIRINVKDISVTSRSAMGVTLMRTTEEEKIVAITKILASDKEDDTIEENEINQEDSSLEQLVEVATEDIEE